MALHSPESILALLRQQKHLPYAHFPERRDRSVAEALRAFALEVGDEIALSSVEQPLYVSVLEGIVDALAADGARTVIRRGETRQLRVIDAALRLRTAGGALFCVASGESLDELFSFESLIQGAARDDKSAMEALERARRSPAFRRVPLECVEEAFRRMGRMKAAAGTDVIRQGDEGDLFYVIARGAAEVWQTGLYDDAPRMVATLGVGDPFGDEALVTGGTRNATIRVTEDADLLTLGRADYQALISQQLVEEVEAAVALSMLGSGYRLLDVRYAEEHEDECIPSSHLLPLPELRGRIGDLDRDARWIVYCRSGKRSAVATLLLKQRGFKAVSLRGGITAWPHEVAPGSTAGLAT